MEKFTIDYFKNKNIKIFDKVPSGYIELVGASTAPKGYIWYSNGKSRFSGEYKSILVKEEIKELKKANKTIIFINIKDSLLLKLGL